MNSTDSLDPQVPRSFERFLLERGWSVSGSGQGLYKRFRPRNSSSERSESLLIPSDPSTSDYLELLNEAIAAAAHRFGLAADDAELLRLFNVDALDDVIKYSKESVLGGGEISWAAGEAMVESMRMSLLSSAKATVEKSAYFGHKLSQFAGRYLDTVRMGQTERGSFVVTAHSRASTHIPTSGRAKYREQSAIPETVITAGEIARTLAKSLAAVRNCLDESQRTGQLGVFKDAVPDGVSRELLVALKGATSFEGYALTSVSLATDQAEDNAPRIIEFEPRDHAVLDRGERFLSSVTPSAQVSIVGWVKVVSRPERGKPGVVNVVVESGSEASQVKVRLSELQFASATQAIRQDRFLRVAGTQEKDGSSYWIVQPRLVAVEGPQNAESPTGVPESQLQFPDDVARY